MRLSQSVDAIFSRPSGSRAASLERQGTPLGRGPQFNAESAQAKVSTSSTPLVLELECLGWIHTMPNELPHLSPQDVTAHARLAGDLAPVGFDAAAAAAGRCVVMTVSFTPGSASLAAFRVTPAGLAWGRENRDLASPAPAGFSPAFGVRSALMLTEKVLGSFLVPAGGKWSYNFDGVKWSALMKYELQLAPPVDFYNEIHRPAHFLGFSEGEAAGAGAVADREDSFA